MSSMLSLHPILYGQTYIDCISHPFLAIHVISPVILIHPASACIEVGKVHSEHLMILYSFLPQTTGSIMIYLSIVYLEYLFMLSFFQFFPSLSLDNSPLVL
jgi:hypothetical protein